MGLAEYLQLFVTSDKPFMLLFVTLFFYFIKSNKDREAQLNHIIEDELRKINSEIHVLMKVWKILLEKELEDKK